MQTNSFILLIKYVEYDTIEGYVENKAQFKTWLDNHNKQRKAEGQIIEKANEFELIEVLKLI